ncbi:MAG: hypothetical protein ABIQ88_11810 [Chitinophagaceae bacterium]
MKKLITAVVLSTVLLVNAAFANKTENVSYKVENAFNQEFGQAKEVNWQKTDNFYRAAFKMNNEVMTAYFTPQGDFMGVVRNMLSSQLPINLQTSLKKDYEGYWITELFEFAKPDSHGYFVTLHDADQVITLQSADGSSWSVYSKAKK